MLCTPTQSQDVAESAQLLVLLGKENPHNIVANVLDIVVSRGILPWHCA